MERYDIFKSEGGFRVCGSTWADGPVIDNSPWFKTREAAERHAEKMRRKDFEDDAFECALGEFPAYLYPEAVRKRAEEIKREWSEST